MMIERNNDILDIVMSDLRRLVENTQTHTQNMTSFLKKWLLAKKSSSET